jgi:hypothetical protein
LQQLCETMSLSQIKTYFLIKFDGDTATKKAAFNIQDLVSEYIGWIELWGISLPRASTVKYFTVVKILFGRIFNNVFQASSYLQVVSTSTDPPHKLSAPFKAGNSRQALTCCISQEYNTKKM